MKKTYALTIFCLYNSLLCLAQAPQLYPSSKVKFVDYKNDTLINSVMGGLNNPMISNIDLNGDGLLDLYIFDRSDSRSLTFLSRGKGSARYQYAPQYEAAFPRMRDWAYLYDYNGDGKPDLFTHYIDTISYMAVYKNTTANAPGSPVEFTLETHGIRFNTRSSSTEISVGVAEFPILGDVDGDGDMDIVMMSFSATVMWYYQNQSMQKYGNKDHLEFDLKTECWGRFTEIDNLKDIRLNYRCSEWISVPKNAHAGSAGMLFDDDGDGDMDLVLSDVGSKEIVLLVNGKQGSGKDIDSFTSIIDYFPRLKKVELPYWVQPALLDIDNDGRKDFVATPLDVTAARRKNFIWYYKNYSTDSRYRFQPEKENFLEEDMFDAGYRSAPTFFDYNGDGKIDLLVATSGNFDTGNVADHLELYLNVGTTGKPVFKLESLDFLNIEGKGLYNLIPYAADVDKDGKVDLLLGNELGTIHYYRNISTTATAQFQLITENLQYSNNGTPTTIDVGSKSAPAVGDVDGDGWPDLIIGEANRNLNYYRNTGKAGTTPEYELVSEEFGGLNRNRQQVPCLADMNGNGKLDLIVGDSSGNVSFYADIIDNLSGTFTRHSSLLYDYGSKTFGKRYGIFTTPAVANLDSDSVPDLLLGNIRGGLMFFSSQNLGPDSLVTGIRKSTVQHHIGKSFKFYPNPVAATAQLSFEGEVKGETFSVFLYNSLGQVEKQQLYRTAESSLLQLDFSQLTQGIYFLSVTDNSGNQVFYQQVVHQQ